MLADKIVILSKEELIKLREDWFYRADSLPVSLTYHNPFDNDAIYQSKSI